MRSQNSRLCESWKFERVVLKISLVECWQQEFIEMHLASVDQFFFCFHHRKMTFVLCLLIFSIIFVPIHIAKRMEFASFFTASDTETHWFCKQKHHRSNWDNMNLIYSFDTLFSKFFLIFSIHLQFVDQRNFMFTTSNEVFLFADEIFHFHGCCKHEWTNHM